MLGARARAAEYNAFKAATARQASHEAEEQKLPPKSAPVSLSAFTKNPQQNRNKGNKAWKPLVLDDTPEQESDASDESSCTISTPTRQTGTVNPKSPLLSMNETPHGPRNPQLIRVEMPKFSIPTAPRAMVESTGRPAFIVNPTPQRLQQHSLIKQSLRDAAISVQSSPSNMPGISGFPYPIYPWPIYLQGFPVLGHPSIPAFSTTDHLVNVMVPSDISPTKQENKFALLSKEYADPATGVAFQQFHSSESTNFDTGPMHHQLPYIPYANMPRIWNPFQQMEPFGEQNEFQRPSIQHFNPDSVTPAQHGLQSRFRQPARIARRFSYSERDGTSLQAKNVDKAVIRTVQTPPPQPKAASADEPYDRNSKMQSFVAAQQALARTGKTVLHNPDLYRVKPNGPSTPVPTETSTTESERESRGGENEGRLANRPMLILKPPPGLESKELQVRGLGCMENSQALSQQDEELQNEFRVGTEGWFQLKPVTKSQRIKMNKAMRLCGDTNCADSHAGTSLRTPSTRQNNLHKWTDQDVGGNKATRALVEQIAKEHLKSRYSTLSSGDGAENDRAANAEIESGAICAIGNIWANLIENGDSDAAETSGVNSVWKYKPAPEYAIERTRLMTGNLASTSFFEEETGAFYNAPSRIARDPRFRPPTKEVTKPRPEDEWTRRDVFGGRRRMGPT